MAGNKREGISIITSRKSNGPGLSGPSLYLPQFIIQPGFVAQHRNYVAEGAIQAYVIDDKGIDHTIQLAIADWWISDYNSYIMQKPATMFVTPMQDSIVLQISYADEEKLKRSNHQYETLFRIMAERSASFFQQFNHIS